MYAAIGIVILIVMVFGGFALTGGALGPVLHALPHEMLIIGGAAVGALVTGNSLHGLKAIAGAFKLVFKGPAHTKQDHVDAIVLTGGLAYSRRLVGWINERVKFLGKVLVYPGEDELLALSEGALRVLHKEEPAMVYE